MTRLAIPCHRESPMEVMYSTVSLGLQSLRSAMLQPTDASLVAVLLTLLMSFATTTNAVLLFVLLLFMTLDFVAAIGRAYRSPVDYWSADKFLGGLVGKLMRLTVIAMAGGLDLVFGVLAGESVRALTPISKASFCWMIAGEGISVLRHIRASEGDDFIPAVIVRALDRLKLGGREPPVRRIYDTIAIEGEDQMLKQMVDDARSQSGETP